MRSLIRFSSLDSTNSEAWRQIERGRAEHGLAIRADRQTAGRGQRGHNWISPVGGLYLSIILQPNASIATAEEFTLWSAWAIAKELNCYLPEPLIKLKWRNDLLIHRRKLGGILVETRCQGSQINYAVIGVGINYTNEVPEGAIALQQIPSHRISSLDHLSHIVYQAVMGGYEHWQTKGMEEVLAGFDSLTPNPFHSGRGECS